LCPPPADMGVTAIESLVPMSLALQIRVSVPNTARPARKVGPAARELTGMLLEGVRERVAAARDHLQAGNESEKQVIVQSALMLLHELRSDLDLFNGGPVAANLDDLYDYMGRRLGACGSAAVGEHDSGRPPGAADLQNGIVALDEVSHLLEALHSAWVFLPAEARSASRN
jgi:flagellar secretion chaperone FliS